MTLNELKNNKEYSFECNICEELKNEKNYDEWGCAFVWFEDYGVEYNYCVENGESSCAIYKLKCDLFSFETDYNTYNYYDINFNDIKWKEKLEDAMCKSLIEFFEL